MKIIDLDTWSRKEHYLFFKRMDYPHYHIGTDLDITNFLRKVKDQGIPFSFSMTYAVTSVMNGVEAFRYRMHGEQVVLHDKIHPSFSYLAPGSEYFKMVTVDLVEPISAFVKLAKEKALTQQKYFVFEDVEGRDDLVYISSIPWVSFTHLSHTISFNKSDAVPRMSWGKYYAKDGKVLMPLNVQAHHSFVDGNNMGEYFDKMQEYLNCF
jgi:chloramphenicol O-acetyltransferase type A